MTKINFEDIKTREELLTRLTDHPNGNKKLSTGNRWSFVKDLFTKEKEEGKIAVDVYYTAGSGNHHILRYL